MKLELDSDQIALLIESLQDRPDYSERDDVRFLDAYIQEEENIAEQEEEDDISDRCPQNGDIVRVHDQPKDSENGYARVVHVNPVIMLVRLNNLNMPFAGSFVYEPRMFDEVTVVRGIGG